MSRISDTRLRYLRNKVEINRIIDQLGLPNKYRDKFLRFLCPVCNEFNTATNPKTNLGRCFRCEKNFNPIDLVMLVRRCGFRDAVETLEKYALSVRQ